MDSAVTAVLDVQWLVRSLDSAQQSLKRHSRLVLVAAGDWQVLWPAAAG